MPTGWSRLSYEEQVTNCEASGLLVLSEAERVLVPICARVTDDLTAYEKLMATLPPEALETLGQLLMKIGTAQRRMAERYRRSEEI